MTFYSCGSAATESYFWWIRSSSLFSKVYWFKRLVYHNPTDQVHHSYSANFTFIQLPRFPWAWHWCVLGDTGKRLNQTPVLFFPAVLIFSPELQKTTSIHMQFIQLKGAHHALLIWEGMGADQNKPIKENSISFKALPSKEQESDKDNIKFIKTKISAPKTEK